MMLIIKIKKYIELRSNRPAEEIIRRSRDWLKVSDSGCRIKSNSRRSGGAFMAYDGDHSTTRELLGI
jgi:hypothetical protein